MKSKIMRKPTDQCLLCKAAQSSKTNSHILPRFISTGFMKQAGKGNKGFEIGGDKPITVQDSPKEDYILCDSCEAYFAVLEGYAAGSFKNWKDKIKDGSYSKRKIVDDLEIVSCNSANPNAVRLLIYSMFWRAGISSHGIFNGYSPRSELMESLRQILLLYKNLNRAALDITIENNPVHIYPIGITTIENVTDESAAVLAAINDGNPCSLNVDKFGFLLFDSIQDVPVVFRNFTNNVAKDCHFMVLSETLWRSVMVTRPLQIIAEQQKQNN